MNLFQNKLLRISALFAISFGVLYSVFGSYLFRLHQVQLDASGDGLKNYFTFAYQYYYGKGLDFNGLLYPYGDLATYADAQPLLVWIFQGLRFVGIDLGNHLLLLLNGSMVAGLVLGVYFIRRIFTYYGVGFWSAIFLAGVCVAMSPQLLRMQSHYALSYMFFIPACWYLLLLVYQKENLIRNRILLFILCLSGGFIHPYLLLINAVFGLAFWFVKAVSDRKWSIINLITILASIIVFMVFMKVIDPVNDRPDNPYGMGTYKTEVSDLLPSYGTAHHYLEETLLLRSDFVEGYGYPSFLFFVGLLILLCSKYRKHDHRASIIARYRDWNHSFIAGLLVLAFAMGLHLLLTGDLIIKLIPPLSQFRSLGRFVWVFYYVGFVSMAVLCYHFFNNAKLKWFKYLSLSMLVIYMLLEMYHYHSIIHKKFVQYSGEDALLHETELLDLLGAKGIDKNDFQAIHTLPASTEGTEKIYLNGDWHVKTRSMPLSFQTGLPLTSCILSRTSINHALNIVQLTSSDFIDKDIITDLNEKDLLVVFPKRRHDEYVDFLSKCKRIGETKELALYRLSIDSLLTTTIVSEPLKSSAFSIEGLRSGKVHSDHTHPFLYYQGFDDESDIVGLKSPGAMLIDGSVMLIDAPLNIIKATKIKISFWYQIQATKSNVPTFSIEALDQNEQVVKSESFRDWDFRKVEILDDWVQIVKEVIVDERVKRIKLQAHGEHLILDHLTGSYDTLPLIRIIDKDWMLYDHHIVRKL